MYSRTCWRGTKNVQFQLHREKGTVINPFRTAVPFWGQTTLVTSYLSRKRDCSSKRLRFSEGDPKDSHSHFAYTLLRGPRYVQVCTWYIVHTIARRCTYRTSFPKRYHSYDAIRSIQSSHSKYEYIIIIGAARVHGKKTVPH